MSPTLLAPLGEAGSQDGLHVPATANETEGASESILDRDVLSQEAEEQSVVAPKRAPQGPTPEEIERHNRLHEPYRS